MNHNDMKTWDIALISNLDAYPWQTVLTDVVTQYDADNYKKSLFVTSYDGERYLGWAGDGCRREGANLAIQPTEADFPLRVTQITKFRRTRA